MMLDTERYQRAKAIFFAACEQPRDRQGDFVREACGSDQALCRAVMDLLAQDADPLTLVGVDGMREHLEKIADSSAEPDTTDEGGAMAGPQPDRIGRYRILRMLGAGGMGMVYLAEQDSPRREVALKVIAPGRLTRQSLRRFEHEAQALGRLQHPGIAQIHEAGMHDFGRGGQPYFAMELVRGRSLMDYCQATGADTRTRLELFAMTCSAVEHAHQQGVVHRDLKPANILVDESSAPPQPKVLDFGVARIIDSDVQATTMHTADQLVGTLAYMSPEQMSGRPEDIDTRSDVYGLGVVLFELLTERLPHDVSDKSVPEAIRTVSESEPATLSSMNRALRGDLEVIVGRALERDKSRRYQSAGELAADLRRHLRDEPIQARPPSAAYQFRKFARRNKALVSGAAAVFLVLVAGIIATSWQARQAKLHAREASASASRALAINSFLRRMLASAQPEVAQGRDVLVVEVLDAAAAELDGSALLAQPDIEHALRTTLGETYLSLGRPAPARTHLQRALELARLLSGEQSHDYAMALVQMASLVHAEGDFDQAFDTAAHAASLLRRVHAGADHHDLAMCLARMGRYRAEQGRAGDAIALVREGLEMFERLGEGRSLDAADARARIAAYSHDPAMGEPLVRDALAIYEAQVGVTHPRFIEALRTLGGLLMMRGAYDAAWETINRAGELVQQVFGPDHPRNLAVLSDLAFCCSLSGDRDRLAQLIDQRVDTTRRVHGESSIHLAGALIDRAYVRCNRDDHAGAASDFRSALDITRDAHAQDARGHVARVGLAHELLRDTQNPAVEIEAEALARETIAAGDGLAAEARWLLGRAGQVLSEVALRRDDLAEAMRLAEDGYDLLGTTALVGRFREDAADRLARIHDALERHAPGMGHAAEAERWRTHARELSRWRSGS